MAKATYVKRKCGAPMYMLLVSLCFVCIPFQALSAVWVVSYPQSDLENDVRDEYPLALLELALKKTGVRYELKQSIRPMRQSRALKRLEENLDVNVVWSMTDVQREQQLRPIRIPITRGLIGWRVFLSHKNSAFLKTPINDMTDLLRFAPVQGINWPDTKILQANGFNVITARDYVEGAQIINDRQADFYPRSVVEVYKELQNQYSQNMRLRKDIAFYYPTAMYFLLTSKILPCLDSLRRALNELWRTAVTTRYLWSTLAKH